MAVARAAGNCCVCTKPPARPVMGGGRGVLAQGAAAAASVCRAGKLQGPGPRLDGNPGAHSFPLRSVIRAVSTPHPLGARKVRGASVCSSECHQRAEPGVGTLGTKPWGGPVCSQLWPHPPPTQWLSHPERTEPTPHLQAWDQMQVAPQAGARGPGHPPPPLRPGSPLRPGMVLGQTICSLPEHQAWPRPGSPSLAGATQGAPWPPQSQAQGSRHRQCPGRGFLGGGSESEPHSCPSCVVLGESLHLPSSQVLACRMGPCRVGLKEIVPSTQ